MPRADMTMASEFGFINVKVVDPLISPSLENVFKIIIPVREYKSLDDFKKAVNIAIAVKTNEVWSNDKSEIWTSDGEQPICMGPILHDVFILADLKEDASQGYLQMSNYFITKQVSFGFPNILAYMLGITNNVQHLPDVEFNKSMSLETIYVDTLSNIRPPLEPEHFSNDCLWVHVK